MKTDERYAYCGRNVGEALRHEVFDVLDRIAKTLISGI